MHIQNTLITDIGIRNYNHQTIHVEMKRFTWSYRRKQKKFILWTGRL